MTNQRNSIIPLCADYKEKLELVELMQMYAKDNNTNLRLYVKPEFGAVTVNIRDQDSRRIYLTPNGKEFHQPILHYKSNTLEEFYQVYLKLEILFKHPSNLCADKGLSTSFSKALGVNNQLCLPDLTKGSAA